MLRLLTMKTENNNKKRMNSTSSNNNNNATKERTSNTNKSPEFPNKRRAQTDSQSVRH